MKLIGNTQIRGWVNSIDLALLLAIAITIPFNIAMCNLFCIVSFFYGLYVYLFKEKKSKAWHWIFIIPLLFFLYIAVSGLSSHNLHKGLVEINKALLIGMLPFILLMLYKKVEYLSKILVAFLFSTTLSTLLLLGVALTKYLSGNPLNQLIFHEFTRLYDQHPVYFSLNIALSIFILNRHYFNRSKKSKKETLFFLAATGILLLGILFCASKIVTVVFVVLYTIQLFLSRTKLIYKWAMVTVFLTCTGAVLISTGIHKRFQEVFDTHYVNFKPTEDLVKAYVFSYDQKESISDLELRFIITKIALFHQMKEGKLWFGYGAGDAQGYLDYYYMAYGLAPNWYEGHNLHNQYLQVFFSYGIVLFLIFLGYLILSAKTLIKSKNLLAIFFLLMVLLAFLFESYLVRNKGIIFFFFFNSLFLVHTYITKKSLP